MSEQLPRWAEQDAPEPYSAAKGAYRRLGPDLDQTTRMLERLAPSDAVHAGSSVGWKKLWPWRLPFLALAAGGLLWALYAVRPTRPSQGPVVQSAEATSPSAAPRATRVDASTLPPESSPHVPPLVAAEVPVRKASVRARPPDLDPTAELELLARARRMLAASPARALALTDEHRLRFRRGQLVQERELLAIEALLNLGRQDDARRRAKIFTQNYPTSVHQHRLGVILDRVVE